MTEEILVWHTKHGTYYYDASSCSRMRAACLEILKERMATGWYFYDPGEPPVAPMAKEDMERMLKDDHTPEIIKQAMKDTWKKYARAAREYNEDKEMWDRIVEAIENNDSDAACRIILDRSDYDYEHVEIQSVKICE